VHGGKAGVVDTITSQTPTEILVVMMM